MALVSQVARIKKRRQKKQRQPNQKMVDHMYESIAEIFEIEEQQDVEDLFASM